MLKVPRGAFHPAVLVSNLKIQKIPASSFFLLSLITVCFIYQLNLLTSLNQQGFWGFGVRASRDADRRALGPARS
jgi:hypothetical protein